MNSQNVKAIAVLGAHGGAGVSTVSTFLDPSSSGHVIELTPGSQLPLHYMPVLVARSTAFGMHKAGEMLMSWHPQLLKPWLVIVADAPMPAPKSVRYRRRALGSRVLGTVELPYLAPLRNVDAAADALEHRTVRRAAARLRERFGLPK